MIETKQKSFLDNAVVPDRRSGLSKSDFLREYARPLKPVALQDAASSWAGNQWTPEFFKETYGDKQFEVDGRSYRLAEIIDLVLASTEANPAPYLRNVNVGIDFRELLPDVSPRFDYCLPNRLETRLFPQHFLKRGEGRYMQLFIGGAGRAFPNIHWDRPPFHTWSTLLCGAKEWILFPPSDAQYMYPHDDSPDVSQVKNVYQPDLDRFPLFAQTTPHRIVQQPGETLFLPSGWWHTAKNLEPSISIAHDQLSSTSWNGFKSHLMLERSARPAYARAFGWYIATVGALLSLTESLGLEI